MAPKAKSKRNTPKKNNSDTTKMAANSDNESSLQGFTTLVENVDSSRIVCKFCSKSYISPKRMRNHQATCLMSSTNTKISLPKGVWDSIKKTEKVNFSCKKCNKKFKFKKSFNEHMKQEHSKLPDSLSCDKCSAKCPSESALKQHIHKVHTAAAFKCPHCTAKFTRHYHVLRHMKQKGCHGGPVNTFRCKICSSSFSRKDNLMYHLRNNHMRHMKTYQCKYCLYGDNNYNKHVRHYVNLHMDKKGYECHHCGKVVGSRMAITKHLEIHGEKKFQCAYCDYKTHTVEVMKRHLYSHTKEKPMKCTICSKSFIQMKQLRKHMLRHKDVVCEICDATFESDLKLKTHMKKHIRANVLTCPYKNCERHDKAFDNTTLLEEHMNAHDKKSHKCSLCNKTFKGEDGLQRHLSTHTLERPRRCMYCVRARAYVRGGRLIRHLRLVHSELFLRHLRHVRAARGLNITNYMELDAPGKVRQEDVNSILEIMDNLQDSVLEGNCNGKVLYGGVVDEKEEPTNKNESPLMSEAELMDCLSQLLVQLIDAPKLEQFGWPNETVDVVLEKVIEQCGQRVADRGRWSRVQRLRENAKHLFLHVIEDRDVKRMLEMQTIDQVVRHILTVNSETTH